MLKYVNRVVDRYGKSRYYFRRWGKSYRLPDDPDSDAFHAEHSALLERTENRISREEIPPPHERSFKALAMRYYMSSAFRSISVAQRRSYPASLPHWHRLVTDCRKQHVMKFLGAMSGTPGAANYFLKRLKTLFEFAIQLEWIATNPTHRVKAYKAGEFHTWTEDEIAAYERCWPLGTRQRLAFDALLYTGQRISDACRLPLPDRSGRIQLVQQKTSTNLVLLVHPVLQASIEAAPCSTRTIISTRNGGAFSAKSLSNFISDAIWAAGLPGRCKAHGLRKATGRRLAEAGASAKEIMAVLGHKTLAEAERYTRAADQALLNERAMGRIATRALTARGKVTGVERGSGGMPANDNQKAIDNSGA